MLVAYRNEHDLKNQTKDRLSNSLHQKIQLGTEVALKLSNKVNHPSGVT